MDKPISDLIEALLVKQDDLFVLEQGGAAKKLTGQTLISYLLRMIDGHGGIRGIEKAGSDGLADTYRITLADTTAYDFTVTNGNGISSIANTGTDGLTDTYTVTYTDGTAFTFSVKNGEKGEKGDNAYTHYKWASRMPTDASHSMGDIPDDWQGVYNGNSKTAPTDWKQYKWYRIRGEQGNPGAAATLTESSVAYQVGTSATIPPSGTWLPGVPTVPQGNYLWTKTTIRFNSGPAITWYTKSREGRDGTGSVSSVNGVSPDGAGNVTVETDISEEECAALIGMLPE